MPVLAAMMVSCSTDDVATTNVSGLDQKVTLNTPIQNENGTRVVETADAGAGLKTSWDSNDQLAVLLANNNVVTMSKSVSDNSFEASVSAEDAAEFSSGKTVYGVNSSSQNAVTSTPGVLNAKVNFTGQDGSLANIAKYDLMYGTGDPTQNLIFRHQICVMKLDLKSDLLAGNITSASFSFTPSLGGALFATNATWNFGSAGKSIVATDAGTLALSSPSIPVSSDGTTKSATIYLAVPERTNLTGTLVMNLSCTNGSTVTAFTKTIHLSNKNFSAGSVQEKTISNLTKSVSVGDYLFSDGTYGSLADNPGKTPVGVFFSTSLSDTERAAGYTHGYVMALKDASTSDAAWTTKNKNKDLSYLDNNSNVSSWYHDMASGYIGTYIHHNLLGGNAAYPAWKDAYNYKNTVAPPAHSSGWYLPTAGQWWDLFANCGNDAALTNDLKNKESASDESSVGISLGNNNALNTVNKIFMEAGGNELAPWKYYWTSTEYNQSGAIMFYCGQDVFNIYIAGKSNLLVVRPVLAF